MKLITTTLLYPTCDVQTMLLMHNVMVKANRISSSVIRLVKQRTVPLKYTSTGNETCPLALFYNIFPLGVPS